MDIAPAQDSPFHIFNALNEDCIQTILRKLTNIDDFVVAAKVCKVFQEYAKENFRTMYKLYNWEKTLFTDHSPERVENIFRIFGHLIDTITLPYTGRAERDHELFLLTVKYCGKTLKGIQFPSKNTPLNEKNVLFSALETVSFYFTLPKNFELNGTLKNLSIYCIMLLSEQPPWFVREFPALEQAVFQSIYNYTDPMLNEFLLLNGRLRKLHMTNCLGVTTLSMCNIFNLVQLEDLKIRTFEFDESQIDIIKSSGKLRKMKHLVLQQFSKLPITRLFNVFAENNIPIETLEFSPLEPINELEHLPTLKSLKQLNLNEGNISVVTLDKFVKTQTELEKVIIEFRCNAEELFKTATSFLSYIKRQNNQQIIFEMKYRMFNGEIDKYMYETILYLARDHANVSITVHLGKVGIPKDVRQENSKWLSIN